MRDIHRILCPVDLSDVSRHAVDHAVRIAGWYDSRITALHVCNPIVIPATNFSVMGTAVPPALTEEEVSAARAQVATCFAAAGAGGVDVVVESGQAANRILELAEMLPTDLIILGTHGLGETAVQADPLSGRLLGAVACGARLRVLAGAGGERRVDDPPRV